MWLDLFLVNPWHFKNPLPFCALGLMSSSLGSTKLHLIFLSWKLWHFLPVISHTSTVTHYCSAPQPQWLHHAALESPCVTHTGQ